MSHKERSGELPEPGKFEKENISTDAAKVDDAPKKVGIQFKMKERVTKKRPSGDIEPKQVSVKLPRTSSNLHYHRSTAKDDMDSIESVIEKGFEHLGQILTPIVSRRRKLSETLASENNSPSKTPKITGLKTGCTVSRGSGRQKYLGSLRRPFPQSKPFFPLHKEIGYKPFDAKYILQTDFSEISTTN